MFHLYIYNISISKKAMSYYVYKCGQTLMKQHFAQFLRYKKTEGKFTPLRQTKKLFVINTTLL